MKKNEWFGTRIIGIAVILIALTGCGGDVPENSPTDSFYIREKDTVQERADESGSRLDELYQDTMNRVLEDEPEMVEGDNAFDRASNILFGGLYRIYLSVRSVAPFLCLSSVTVGLMMFLLASKNKRLRRLGLFAFMIGIPIAMIVFVFGIGILNGIFLY